MLGSLPGLALGPDDFRAVLTGCVVPESRPVRRRAHTDARKVHELEGNTSVFFRTTGFAADAWTTGFVMVTEVAANDCSAVAVDIASDAEPSDLEGLLGTIDWLRIDFPGLCDGRGCTLAAKLRRQGAVSYTTLQLPTTPHV